MATAASMFLLDREGWGMNIAKAYPTYRELDPQLGNKTPKPQVDQGSEFVSRDMVLWAYQRGVVLDFSRPGKPTDNAFIEAFNGRFRTECLRS